MNPISVSADYVLILPSTCLDGKIVYVQEKFRVSAYLKILLFKHCLGKYGILGCKLFSSAFWRYSSIISWNLALMFTTLMLFVTLSLNYLYLSPEALGFSFTPWCFEISWWYILISGHTRLDPHLWLKTLDRNKTVTTTPATFPPAVPLDTVFFFFCPCG